MDVKSVFLNGLLQDKVFVQQPKGFQEPHFPDHVLRLKNALYGLKQAPRAWYDCLTTYPQDEKSLLVAQVYIDDIVFGSSIDSLAQEFSE